MRRCILTIAALAFAPSGAPYAIEAAREALPSKACTAAGTPATLNEAVAWLDKRSAEMIRGCRRAMHDGTFVFPPQVGPGYEAFWLRDYAYMLEGNIGAFSVEELDQCCRVFMKAQRADGAMVDCVRFNGEPVYKPGLGTMGENPLADGSQFAVDVAWHTWKRTGNLDLVRDFITTGDVNECVNDGYKNVSNYLVSATLPLEGIRAMVARHAHPTR